MQSRGSHAARSVSELGILNDATNERLREVDHFEDGHRILVHWLCVGLLSDWQTVHFGCHIFCQNIILACRTTSSTIEVVARCLRWHTEGRVPNHFDHIDVPFYCISKIGDHRR